ncbi:hypothetical protein [Novosphingobium gossypii]|uniref:hypothetical protein n=1 Tax=Novosphingobium gossypii TaxID=1604774 RepID=UPI003D23B60E
MGDLLVDPADRNIPPGGVDEIRPIAAAFSRAYDTVGLRRIGWFIACTFAYSKSGADTHVNLYADGACDRRTHVAVADGIDATERLRR